MQRWSKTSEWALDLRLLSPALPNLWLLLVITWDAGISIDQSYWSCLLWLSLSATTSVLQGAFVYNAAKPYFIFPNTSPGVYIIATHKKFIERHGFARVRKYSKANQLIVKSKYIVPTTSYLLLQPLDKVKLRIPSPVADLREGLGGPVPPPLSLDQTKVRRAQKMFLEPPSLPPFSQGLIPSLCTVYIPLPKSLLLHDCNIWSLTGIFRRYIFFRFYHSCTRWFVRDPFFRLPCLSEPRWKSLLANH